MAASEERMRQCVRVCGCVASQTISPLRRVWLVRLVVGVPVSVKTLGLWTVLNK